MKTASWVACLAGLQFVLSPASRAADAPLSSSPPAKTGVAFNKARYFPAPGQEAALIAGKFAGSNESPATGFKTLAEIKEAPQAGQWGELIWPNDQPYRWIRYEAAAGSFGKVAELEFYAGERRLNGPAFGSIGKIAEHAWQKAFDHKPETWMESDQADGQFAGLDLREAATARTPILDPIPGEHDQPVVVTLKCPTPGATIRYTLDGTIPAVNTGLAYTAPIPVKRTATLVAASFLPDRAPSPPAVGTYLVGAAAQPGFITMHLGNSLTQTTHDLAKFIRTAGYRHEYRIFARPGAWTKELWNIGLTQEKERWESLWNPIARVDHLTVQPRDFDVAEEADYEIRFFNLFRTKSPGVQPWLYTEWTEMKRQRPTDAGAVPSSQMKQTPPALTWEESMAAMLLYVEEVQRKIGETYHEGKRPRVLPSALAMAWIKHLIDQGKFPGLAPGSFYPALFQDQVHPNPDGGYLVDLTWFSAFYGISPEGKVLPAGTNWSATQAAALQRLAWEVVRNYPDCGLYKEGHAPVAPPEFTPAASPAGGVVPVALSSATPGAWFRYTLDGTSPSRTRGYVYCGVISVRPGMAVKAIAYQSGMADSPVVEAAYPAVAP